MQTTPAARVTFADYFAAWAIQLPEELPPGIARQVENDHGWHLRVRLDPVDSQLRDAKDDQGAVEVYAEHRMTNPRHFRIDADGQLEDLEAPSDMVIFPADSTEDERAEISRNEAERNRRVMELLNERGLLGA